MSFVLIQRNGTMGKMEERVLEGWHKGEATHTSLAPLCLVFEVVFFVYLYLCCYGGDGGVEGVGWRWYKVERAAPTGFVHSPPVSHLPAHPQQLILILWG